MSTPSDGKFMSASRAVGAGDGMAPMYAVQIESLEDFQKKLTTILQDLEVNNAVMTVTSTVEAVTGGGDSSGTFGSFPEGQALATAYEQTKQDLIKSFNEVTQLVNTMISVVGANANRYKQTEADIQSKFNAILQQSGDAPMATASGTPTQSYYPASAASSNVYATQSSAAPPNTGTGSAPTTSADTAATSNL